MENVFEAEPEEKVPDSPIEVVQDKPGDRLDNVRFPEQLFVDGVAKDVPREDTGAFCVRDEYVAPTTKDMKIRKVELPKAKKNFTKTKCLAFLETYKKNLDEMVEWTVQNFNTAVAMVSEICHEPLEKSEISTNWIPDYKNVYVWVDFYMKNMMSVTTP